MRVGAGGNDESDAFDVVFGFDPDDLAAGDHEALHLAIGEIENAIDNLALVLGEDAFFDEPGGPRPR